MISNVKRTTDRKAAKVPDHAEPDEMVRRALRSAYDQTVEESIPQEMLDLLGKLK